MVLAAEKGQWEVCAKLAEHGALLNMANWVIETCSDCVFGCCCIIIMLTLFFYELIWQDGLDLGC